MHRAVIAARVLVAGLSCFAPLVHADGVPSSLAPVDAAASASAPAVAAAPTTTPTFQFAKMRTPIAGGDRIGSMESGIFCVGKRDRHAFDKLETAVTVQAADAFKRVAAAQALPLFTKELSAFDTGTNLRDADYRIGGTLMRLDGYQCGYGSNIKGWNEVEVKWEVFSTREQRVVLTRTTTGRHTVDAFIDAPNGVGRDFESKSYDVSLKALFASPEFAALRRGGGAAGPATTAFGPLTLPLQAGVPGDSQQNAAELKKAVVTLVTDIGTGSGFYIADGYLLTDKHVVGASHYVKVRLSDNRELVGEVVRQDGPNDVALVKTESAGVPTLRCRATEPAVGENVFAIGSPFGKELAGTFTRGVLSGVREITSRRFYQSDVAVNPGNSGGPLVDGHGDVLGLVNWGIPRANGLSFFVPIHDALERLAVGFGNVPVATTATTTTTTTTTVTTAVSATAAH